MNVNENILQLTGKASIPEPLEVGSNYKLICDGSVITSTESDNHDGTINKIFKFKPVTIEIQTKLGKTIKAKDTRKLSQLLRGFLRKKWINSASKIEEEEMYEKFMYGVMRDLDELVDRYIPDL